MKQLLVLTGIAVFIISCNNSNSAAPTNGMDSVMSAMTAKDSLLEKIKPPRWLA